MRKALGISWRVAALTVALAVLLAVVNGLALAGLQESAEPEGGARVLLPFLFACLFETATMTYLVIRSALSRLRLASAVFVVFYGTTTVMTQIESAFFAPVARRLPEGMLPRLFVAGAVVAALFAPLAVRVLGKWRTSSPVQANPHPGTLGEWSWKLALISALYVVVYFTFGYWVAWRSPSVREYYGGGALRPFFSHLANVLSEDPGLAPFQALRGLLWAGIAIPVARWHGGRPWEARLAVALAFGAPFGFLLLPNPYMPEAVRFVHLIETLPSNLFFGWTLVAILQWRAREVAR